LDGDWGWGFGDWGLGPTPNPQSPIPNPQSPIPNYFNKNMKYNSFFIIFNNYLINNNLAMQYNTISAIPQHVDEINIKVIKYFIKKYLLLYRRQSKIIIL